MRKHFSTLLAAVALLCMGSFSFAADAARVPIPVLYGVKAEAPRYSTDVQAEAAKAWSPTPQYEVATSAARLCGTAPAADLADTLGGFAHSYAMALTSYRPFASSGVLASGSRPSATLNS